ncbi:Highly reducing polyketide synthase azaB, partial [Colletotrichum shisoi]
MAPYMSHGSSSSELSSPVDGMHSPRGGPADPVAVIGMSCKFSGEATSPEKLWQLVVDGRDGWTTIPKSRFNADAFYDEDHAKIGMSNVVGGHFLKEDVAEFDASFFNFTAEIANAMDPQIRLLLESVFESPENALHLAVNSIRNGESRMAIVGASNLLLNPDPFIIMSSLGVLGADGRCFAWDSRANGYGRGEGVATLLLKPLRDAVADGDPIHAVIRETAINQDGKTPTITSPSSEAQEELIRACYRRAGLDPAKTPYVEAHMTGTPTGDPIEARAISRVFSKGRGVRNPVLVGSIKTNLGHLEASSGIAGVIKAIMMLKHGVIPPSLNYEQANPDIDMNALGVQVPTMTQDWPKDMPRRISVNNYGYGGTNGHVIIDGAVEHVREHSTAAERSDHPRLIVMSSKDSNVINRMVANLKDYLEARKSSDHKVSLDDLAYTLHARRSQFPWRAATSSINCREDITEALEDPTRKTVALAKEAPRVGYVFNGQGAQWHAMGRELIAIYPVFRKALLHADVVLEDYGADWSLMEELQRDEKSTRVNEPRLGQPVCVALQVCLVDLLNSWGIHPSAVTSHSSGEIAAAYAAGALTFEEALSAAYFRGHLAEKHRSASRVPGGMIAVGLGAEDALSYMVDHGVSQSTVTVACVNSPSSVTLSGDLDVIERLEKDLSRDQIFARKLKVKSAYHSHHMLPMAQEYLRALQNIMQPKLEWHNIVYSSPVTGDLIDSPEKLGPQHWVNNLLQPVQFSKSFEKMCFATNAEEPAVDFILEVGPHSALAGPIRQICSKAPGLKGNNLPYASVLVRGRNAGVTTQSAAGALWCAGYPVDILAAVNCQQSRENLRVIADLPPYPWNHSNRFWQESRLNVAHRHRKHVRNELIGSLLPGPASTSPMWRHFLKASDSLWLRDHLVQSDIVYPGAGGIAMAIEALRQFSKTSEESIDGYCLRDIQISNALVIPDSEGGIEVQLFLHPCNSKNLEPGWYEFSLKSPSSDGESWTEHINGYISQRQKPNVSIAPVPISNGGKADLEEDYSRNVESDVLFARLRKMGLHHGPTFQNMLNIHASDSGSKFQFKVADVKSAGSHLLHPTTLDSIFQGAYAALPVESFQNSMVMPRAIEDIFVSQLITSSPGTRFESHATVDRLDRSGFRSSVATHDVSVPGTTLLEVKGLFCQAVGGIGEGHNSHEPPKLLFKMHWHPDLTLMPVSTLKDPLLYKVDSKELSINKKLVRAAWYFIQDAIRDMSADEAAIANMEWYHKSLYSWMQCNYEAGLVGTLARGSASWAKTSKGMKHMLLDEVASESVNGRLLCRVGRSRSKILRKQAAPLEVMMEGNLLYEFYGKALRCNRSYDQVQKLVRLYSMKNPRAKVLEIGGGTGGCTGSVLKGLCEDTPDGRYRFSSYTFTDVSTGFFEAASKKFASYGDMINFKKLDIETDPGEQSFEAGSYDLIIACQVLHATKNMETTMKHVRKLLKNGGKLVLVETTKDTLDVQLAFGTLPGWWLAEEPERKGGPNLTLSHWGRVLENSGFGGIDLDVRDTEDDANYSFSVMTSTATTTPSYPHEVAILGPPRGVPMNWTNELEKAIRSTTGAITTTSDWTSIDATGKVCIMLVEMIAPFLSRLGREDFARIQRLLTTARGVLWVTRAGLIDGTEPDMALHSGLLRTLRMEDAGRRYVSLDLETTESPWSTKNAGFIVDVLKASFDFSSAQQEIDCEYAVRDSLLHVSRIYNHDTENRALAPETFEPEPELKEFRTTDPTMDMKMEVGTPGLLDSLRFREVEHCDAALEADQIEIEPRAFGLNFRDVLVALGQLDETIMGYECSGIVTRLGSEAKEASGLSVGDRVCAILRGHWATRVCINWPCAVRIPDDMSFEEAATIPMVFATAYHGLYDVGRLARGETILVHAATRGVGTEAKREFVMKEFGIPKEHIFSSRDTSFGPALMAATDGKGVDVVLNSLAGPLLKETWNCMARFGRFVEIGKRDMEAAKNLDMSPLRRAVSFAAVDVFQLGKYKGGVIQDALCGVMDMFGKKKLRAVAPVTTFSVSDVDEAFRLMQSGKHMGKVVVVPKKTDLVKVVSSPKADSIFPNMKYEQWLAATSPKISATWNIHNNLPDLDFLVLLSSLTGLGGNTSQANYSAGGTFQDAFAKYRTSQGFPGVSIDLASIQEVGFVANTEGVADRLTRTGLADIDEATLRKIVETAIRNPRRPVDLSQLITGILEFDETSTVAWVNDRRFSSLQLNRTGPSGSRGRNDQQPGAAARLSDLLQSATSAADAAALILDAIVFKLADMFGLDAAEIDKKHPVSRYGVDSLIAVELRNWLVSSAGAETTSIFDVLHSPSLSVLAEKIGEK